MRTKNKPLPPATAAIKGRRSPPGSAPATLRMDSAGTPAPRVSNLPIGTLTDLSRLGGRAFRLEVRADLTDGVEVIGYKFVVFHGNVELLLKKVHKL